MSSCRIRNFTNLVVAAVAFILVTGCFWSRGTVSETDEPTSDPGSANTTEVSSGAPSPVALQTKQRDEGDFIVQHLEVSTPKYRDIDRQVKGAKLLEDAADKLNQALSLPRDIYLRTKDCSEVNAFYNAAERSVTMCYELMEHFYRIFRSTGISDEKAYSKMNDAVRFVFLHEIGHALIDQYQLPVAGNEEDAADRCSAYINLKELGEDGVRAVFAAAEAFSIESKRTPQKRNLADEHLLSEQRFYNSLCMIYGSNPEKHANIVNEGYLPKERAVRCRGEYQRAVSSWVSLLEPWRKN